MYGHKKQTQIKCFKMAIIFFIIDEMLVFSHVTTVFIYFKKYRVARSLRESIQWFTLISLYSKVCSPTYCFRLASFYRFTLEWKLWNGGISLIKLLSVVKTVFVYFYRIIVYFVIGLCCSSVYFDYLICVPPPSW